jgi:hypothetical protein
MYHSLQKEGQGAADRERKLENELKDSQAIVNES